MSCIRTHSGAMFNLLDPRHSRIVIEDIARALSRICRFTGHTKYFYSVAQHSVLVSRLVPEHLALEGLMHDAAEAYLGDVSSPLKALLPDYRRIEHEVEWAIAEHFRLAYPWGSDIHAADRSMLYAEQATLMYPDDMRLTFGVAMEAPLSSDAAYTQFLERFDELSEQRGYRATQAIY